MLKRDSYGYKVALGMVVGLTIAYLGVLLLLAQVANWLLPLTTGSDEADQAQAENRRLDAEPGRRQTRRAAIPQLRETAGQRLGELQQQRKIPPPENEPAELTAARKARLDAEILADAFAAIGWNKPAALFDLYLGEQEKGRRWVRVAEWDHVVAGYVTVLWESDDPLF